MPLKIDIKSLRVAEGEKVSLAERPTSVAPLYPSKSDYSHALKRHAERLEELHEQLYAAGRHSVLIVLQGTDSSGKDGAIKHVMTGINPQGCRVVAFKTPTPTEARHDFLWRTERQLPERGAIGVFNRSYYEAVLIERVHPQFLTTEGVYVAPSELEALWAERYHSIRAFERHLTANGTRIIKIFLHLSKAEQTRRLQARIDDPLKAWKASRNDVEERKFWKDYQRVYELALGATSVVDAPWHIVPADDKKNARLFVSEIVIEAMKSLKLDLPPVTPERKRELKEIRAALEG